MLCGIPPFYTSNRQELFERIKFAGPQYPKYLSPNAKNILESLLKKDPAKRLGANSAEEVKQHAWFKGVSWEQLYKKKYDAPFVPVIKNELDLDNFDTEFTEKEVNSMSMTEGGTQAYPNLDGNFYKSEPILTQNRFFILESCV
jgi:serum/glucocorticoid-regulated kinase 2